MGVPTLAETPRVKLFTALELEDLPEELELLLELLELEGLAEDQWSLTPLIFFW